jgi:hypothetical protein
MTAPMTDRVRLWLRAKGAQYFRGVTTTEACAPA